MKYPARTAILAAAVAGLVTGCATPAPKACHQCQMGGKSDKVSCGTKSSCTSKHTCKSKGNCSTKGS